jgi:hypothetical protein
LDRHGLFASSSQWSATAGSKSKPAENDQKDDGFCRQLQGFAAGP